MKKLLILIFAAVSSLATFAQNKPMPSPPASVSTTVGTTEVTITYFRPQMKGRKIFGDGKDFLVPYGKLWRTGANGGTKVSFSNDVTVMGQSVKKGDYLLLSKPGEKSWVVMFYTEFGMGDQYDKFDQSKVAYTFNVPTEKVSDSVEALTMQITDLSQAKQEAKIQIAWANTSVKLGFTAP